MTDALNNMEPKKLLAEIDAEMKRIALQIEQLTERRKSLGLKPSEEKKNLKDEINSLTLLLEELKDEEDAIISGTLEHCGINWRTIDLDEDYNRALVISEDVLEMMPFHEMDGEATWENSSLRWWLNTEFYENLPAYMRIRIVEVALQNQSGSSVPNRKSLHNKVFLLSEDEAEYYFEDTADRIASYQDTPVCWWLRSPSSGDTNGVASVGDDGNIYDNDESLDDHGYGVRPAMWIRL
ncbi:MAG: DUF6273 domain-containing protein [Coriobacteriia bacterium]|nr:DUF6273 domain-containing protein [Coriobacteriia bacterium]MCL2750206.1 DUF6273 domain-containing protein [Coriobacteriia bacterium]